MSDRTPQEQELWNTIYNGVQHTPAPRALSDELLTKARECYAEHFGVLVHRLTCIHHTDSEREAAMKCPVCMKRERDEWLRIVTTGVAENIKKLQAERDEAMSACGELKSSVNELRTRWETVRSLCGAKADDTVVEVFDYLTKMVSCSKAQETLLSLAKMQKRALDSEAELSNARAACAQMREAAEYDSPYPVHDVLTGLSESVNHLLNTHDCDHEGHEIFQHIAGLARRMAQKFLQAQSDCGKGWRSPEEWAKLEACCAQMREALSIGLALSDNGTEDYSTCERGFMEKANQALSTDCGQSILAKMDQLRKALELWRAYWQSPPIDPEQQGEDFTAAWHAMEEALKP